jgi:hypothetical protein
MFNNPSMATLAEAILLLDEISRPMNNCSPVQLSWRGRFAEAASETFQTRLGIFARTAGECAGTNPSPRVLICSWVVGARLANRPIDRRGFLPSQKKGNNIDVAIRTGMTPPITNKHAGYPRAVAD